MTLHVPRNKDAGSFSKAWQNSFYQITLQLQRALDALKENLIGTSNDINSKRAFLPHDPWVFFELVASTTANSAITITKKLGQRVISFAVEELNVILSGQVFSGRPVLPDRIVEGDNVTITRKLGEITIAASSAAATTYYEPVTNGDSDFPEIMFEDGDVMMHEVDI